MSWLQVHIDTPRGQTERLEDALLVCGAVSVTLTDSADNPILEPGVGEMPLWDRVTVTGLFEQPADADLLSTQLLEQLPSLNRDDFDWQALDDQPWERTWMDHFSPIQCGERLWICPSWQAPPDASAVNLRLDPGLAFGSGTHPTTFLCLQWLDSIDLAGRTVVDYGCGSGILGIAALLLGAERVIAVDNDPQALIATRDNLARNDLGEQRLSACAPGQLGQRHPDCQADVLVANILAGPLIGLADTLTRLTPPGGKLCLSGITAGQAMEVQSAYPAVNFAPPALREEWVRLTGTRTATRA